MTQLSNKNDRKMLMKIANVVHLGMKDYISLPDVVSENIDTAQKLEQKIIMQRCS